MISFLSREVIVGIAILGGLASLAAIVIRGRRNIDPAWVTRMNRLAYVLMGISVLLFIVRGLTLPPGA